MNSTIWSQIKPVLRSTGRERMRRHLKFDLARVTKKLAGLMQGVQALKVEIAAVHDVEGAGLRDQ